MILAFAGSNPAHPSHFHNADHPRVNGLILFAADFHFPIQKETHCVLENDGFSGNANQELAGKVASRLYLTLGKADVGKFSDGEIAVELNENVRGKDVFVVQSTCAPTNDNLMELLVMIDALRRASAQRITAVVPYFGYARQDRRVRSSRVPITAKVVADMMDAVGVDRVLTMDLHAEQIQGFFSCPVDNVYGSPILNDDIVAQNYENLMVVSPDIGGVVRARAIAKQLDEADLAIIDKRRPRANEAQVMNLIGEVDGRTCLLVDDMVDTAGTLCSAANALKERGALAGHGLLYPRGAVGQGSREHSELAAGPAGSHRYDSSK